MNRAPSGDWLSLRRVPAEERAAPGAAGKPRVFISVPKRAVRLATRRNRLKRLLREAVRSDRRFLIGGGNYHFRVLRAPANDGLEAASEAVRKLANALFKD